MEVKTSIDQRTADNIRALAIAMVEKAKSGHPGGPMGGADFIHILYSEFLNFDPDDLTWPMRDRFFLDPGHMSAMLYAQLGLIGSYTMEELENFRQWGSPTPGHPEIDVKRGIENTSGPLGLGHAFGVGSAIAERFLVERFGEWMSHRTFIYISDGGIQEEISQGVGRIAGFLGLGQVVMFYDANDIQLSTEVHEVTREDTAAKYSAWGWHVQTITGNDPDAIRMALKAATEETERPSLIIGHTIMGKGAVTADGTPYEGKVDTHGKPLGNTGGDFPKTLQHLGANPDNPFLIFEDVREHYHAVLADKRKKVQDAKKEQQKWSAENPEMAKKLEHFLRGNLPDIDYSAIPQKANAATRDASASVLSYLADHVENMVVASADLSNSDKTDAFLKKRKAFEKGNFSGGFLQAGVSELSMAAIMTGMGLHGGVIPACGTFFAFSDYMKPVLRVAALMQTPVIFIWTHDAFRVGEDGPTHQPIEQEAQLRLLEKLKNHAHHRSLLALRPADSAETTVAWKMALENRHTPTGLILSRQGIKDLPASSGNRYQEALASEQGGYIVQDCPGTPDVVLIANGSEVATLVEGAKLLESDGIKTRIVSVPSEGRFRDQEASYQQSILPSGILRFGMTAGLPVNLEGLVGENGKVFGLEHFGYSAPYQVLDEKFGFTGENVHQQVKALMA
ncbi:MAG: transketolase [Saprospiraceae bacterium]|nr:transketolase [Saprospiraceae bacterium]HPG08965.1 transketolase [Saprospiraceae bacterium]HQU52790.1 transketolase [Saprospiraceae bacterium]